jgi:hypothetical protein
MFWIITIAVVVAFVAVISWLGRARGSAKGSKRDLSRNSLQTRWKSQGDVGNYDQR